MSNKNRMHIPAVYSWKCPGCGKRNESSETGPSQCKVCNQKVHIWG